MPRLPEIVLDDRHFQDLVNEARVRVARRCPEWTDHNVSDPGITLIELFAWLTETLIYRVNRIPAKLHVALLELLGMRLRPPTAARTDLRFRLAAPPEESTSSSRSARPRWRRSGMGADEPVVFQTDEDFTIPVAQADRVRGRARRQGEGRRRRPRRGEPEGAGPAAVRHAAEGRGRALPRLRQARSTGCSCRSTSTARRRRAQASTRRTRRSAGRSPSGTASGRRPRCSRTAPAASTTAAASSSCSSPNAARR